MDNSSSASSSQQVSPPHTSLRTDDSQPPMLGQESVDGMSSSTVDSGLLFNLADLQMFVSKRAFWFILDKCERTAITSGYKRTMNALLSSQIQSNTFSRQPEQTTGVVEFSTRCRKKGNFFFFFLNNFMHFNVFVIKCT